ncbi:MAG: translation initiation factor [Bacteroidota bacterium]|nr:translation initiation factor [Bacteroidota bacterium]
MSKKNKKPVNIVYSTNPDYEYKYNEKEEMEIIPPSEQVLYVSLDRKNRKGKVVSLISGFQGPNEELKSLGKKLKSLCGTGGSAKDGEILIQGDFRDRIMEALKKEGYGVKRKGG